jgi:hypothetical protein
MLKATAIALAAGLLALTGCGGDGSGSAAASAPAVPEDCLQSWNAESAALTYGRHVYTTHRAAQAQVLVVEPSSGSINIKADQACAVVFAVDPGDYEYGDVGMVVTSFGWASMRELARGDEGRLAELQDAAYAAPNVQLFPDGTLQPV